MQRVYLLADFNPSNFTATLKQKTNLQIDSNPYGQVFQTLLDFFKSYFWRSRHSQ